jgi:endo-1,4-beta-xylanase
LNINSSKLSAVVNIASTNSNIDGIAVSLALDLDSDMDDVASMFEALAGTGKLVYVTNLQVSVSDETSEQYSLQSDVYQSVIESFIGKVPASQPYGVSFASPVR